VQPPQAPPSRRHSNAEPPSFAETSKSAEAELVGSDGEESIVVCGAVVSTVKVRLAGVSVLPASSTARTRTV
jgi:hypothetical protein